MDQDSGGSGVAVAPTGAVAGDVGIVAAVRRWALRPGSRARFWLRPPGWILHLIHLAATVMLLASTSVPGSMFDLAIASSALLSCTSLVWAGRTVLYGIARIRGRASGRAASLLVVPLVWLVAAGLIVADVPLRARWALSRGAFEDAVADIGPADRDGAVSGDWHAVDVPGRIGLYDITAAYTVDEGVIFYEPNGAFIDDAGFAYLPGGPSDALENGRFEMPTYRHLGGDWYAWTASW